jgi:hypothetical protein
MAWAAHDDETLIGAELQGVAWHGVARFGWVWQGLAWFGEVRQGEGHMWQRNTCPCGFDGSGIETSTGGAAWQT